jgi:hypothetical protein
VVSQEKGFTCGQDLLCLQQGTDLVRADTRVVSR